MQEKFAKGLYYHCNEILGPNHYCQNKSLQVLIVDGKRDEGEY